MAAKFKEIHIKGSALSEAIAQAIKYPHTIQALLEGEKPTGVAVVSAGKEIKISFPRHITLVVDGPLKEENPATTLHFKGPVTFNDSLSCINLVADGELLLKGACTITNELTCKDNLTLSGRHPLQVGIAHVKKDIHAHSADMQADHFIEAKGKIVGVGAIGEHTRLVSHASGLAVTVKDISKVGAAIEAEKGDVYIERYSRGDNEPGKPKILPEVRAKNIYVTSLNVGSQPSTDIFIRLSGKHIYYKELNGELHEGAKKHFIQSNQMVASIADKARMFGQTPSRA